MLQPSTRMRMCSPASICGVAYRVPLELSSPALVYIARRQGTGIARPGYIQQVVEAARDWGLPQPYIRSLARWSPSRWGGARARDVGEAGCEAG